ncbi:TetR/AcrR family transcriptional regulator [Virgibacillus halodenitrificans]|jgi:TetR/AcrR family transcriptional regulator, fatty acid metabolism regulator protein|uniref:TetR family transcriptional regulator n=1 Tax=Virgibacillus halodenitrificans TaxID=1482 RepID=A0AAC9IYZ7_VIRHA|nr:TetR/AcrR family transcriptional regulator [Virgibacillus halodenitrificans]APC48088.1 TetR family transcriptional regulator [Virgibacillus halodenitrificans]MBD1223721.1 TetR/AcrR family transcriptional regulator [Virgibacillus halodenitrificans]MCG1027860.1 TetR/AcrR family transcriptional regulator [Virgibacillus halodenitrificans]MCJ0931686.1 TetR family transcriptional regulator [Virgibacillus halodenitrificans]MEC2159915.1 TetR/AcrR family transcriptional regulator [Virgibacillus halo
MKKNKPKYKQIIDAAVVVIAENGYHASQVSKIAKKAGVADGTIYLYFKNKEDILVSVFEEKMGQFIEEIEKGISDKQTANDKLLTLIMLHFRQLADNHHLATVTQLELRQSDPQLRLKINKVLKPYLLVIDSIIKEGIEGSSFRDNLNTQLVRQMIFGTLDETVTNWVMKERKYDLVAQAEDVHALLINGLSVS